MTPSCTRSVQVPVHFICGGRILSLASAFGFRYLLERASDASPQRLAYPARTPFSAEIAIACSYPNFLDNWRFRMLFAIDNSFRNALEPSVTISTTRLKW